MHIVPAEGKLGQSRLQNLQQLKWHKHACMRQAAHLRYRLMKRVGSFSERAAHGSCCVSCRSSKAGGCRTELFRSSLMTLCLLGQELRRVKDRVRRGCLMLGHGHGLHLESSAGNRPASDTDNLASCAIVELHSTMTQLHSK